MATEMKSTAGTLPAGSLELGRRQFLALAATSVIGACSGESVYHPTLAPNSLLARGPQVAQVSQTAGIVAWRSKDPVVGSVEYGDSPAYGQEATVALDQTEHVFALQGLTPGTRYHYRLKLDGRVESEGHYFDTAATGAAPLRFAVLGDSGVCSPDQMEVAQSIRNAAPDLVIHTGDVVYYFGAPDELDPNYFLPYHTLIDRIPFYACLGNHDVLTSNGAPLLGALYMPTNSADGSSRFYSFDRGDVHFVALDSNQDTAPGSLQYLWLQADLAATTARWTVVFAHHPPYSNAAEHGSDMTVRANLVPLFDAYGVDLVFSGHDHNYERSLPMVNGNVVNGFEEPDFMDPAGTIYLVTAGGGNFLYPSGADTYTAFSDMCFHCLLVDVNAFRLTLQTVVPGGAVIDRFSITKS